MSKYFPHMTDSPERHTALGGMIYGSFPFLVLPFSLVLLIIGVKDETPYLMLEYTFQAINFTALCIIYRDYLSDSWLSARIPTKQLLTLCLGCAAVIVAVYLASFLAFRCDLYPKADVVFRGILPMTGLELIRLPKEFLLGGGLPAALFLVALGPVITACLYYAPVFAPRVVAGHPIRAYVAVALWIAVPRVITYHTSWGGWKELELYLAQLPIHLLACWAYQKADTIWAPIFTHAIANLICCVLLFAFQFAGLPG